MPTESLELAPSKEAPIATNPPVIPPRTSAGRFVSVRESMGIGTGKKKAAAKPEDKKFEDKKPEEKPAEKKVEYKKADPVVVHKPIDEEKLGRAIGETIAKSTKPPEAEKPKDESEILPAELKREYQVLKHMAKKTPALAGKPKEFIESFKKLEAYKTEWLAKHKGKKFDIEDAEHEEFLAGNDVDWDKSEFAAADRELIKEEVSKEIEGKFSGKLSEIEKREKERQLIPQVDEHMAVASKVMLNELGDADFQKFIDAVAGGKKEEYEKMLAANPVYDDVLPLLRNTRIVSSELFLIANDVRAIDENSVLHRDILAFVDGEEKRLKAMPAEKQLNGEGKVFATAEEFSKMTTDERARHWHFTDKDYASLYAFKQAKLAKKLIANDNERFQKRVQTGGYKLDESTKGALKDDEKEKEKPAPVEVDEKTPPGIIAPNMAPRGNRREQPKDSVRSKILMR